MHSDETSDANSIGTHTPIEATPQTRVFSRYLAASTASAYVSAVILSYPLTALSIGEARAIQNFILAPFRYIPLLGTDLFMEYFGMVFILWLPPVLVCVVVSMAWVVPISALKIFTPRGRVLCASTAGAIASFALYIVLALNLNLPPSTD